LQPAGLRRERQGIVSALQRFRASTQASCFQIGNRVAILDHISGGRLNFPISASGLPRDWEMFNVDGGSTVS
jgi:hypothetical protein